MELVTPLPADTLPVHDCWHTDTDTYMSSTLLCNVACCGHVETNRSQNLQKYKWPCLAMSSVMSTCVRRQPTHMLAGLDSMDVPHWQHRLERLKRKHCNNTYVVYKQPPNMCAHMQANVQAPSRTCKGWIWWNTNTAVVITYTVLSKSTRR